MVTVNAIPNTLSSHYQDFGQITGLKQQQVLAVRLFMVTNNFKYVFVFSLLWLRFNAIPNTLSSDFGKITGLKQQQVLAVRLFMVINNFKNVFLVYLGRYGYG